MTDEQEHAMRRFRETTERLQALIPELPRVAPHVVFWDRMLGEYFEDASVIKLPTPEHLAHYHGEPVEECRGDLDYLHLHELAHWATGGEGHTYRMYAVLFAMARCENYRMMKIRKVEMEYKPRAAKMGWRRYVRS